MEQDISQQILAKLDKLTEDVSGLKQGQQKLEERFDSLYVEQKLQGIMLSQLTKDVENLSEDLEQLHGDVDRQRLSIVVIEDTQHEIKKMLKDDTVYHQELVKRHGPRIEALEKMSETLTMDMKFVKTKIAN